MITTTKILHSSIYVNNNCRLNHDYLSQGGKGGCIMDIQGKINFLEIKDPSPICKQGWVISGFSFITRMFSFISGTAKKYFKIKKILKKRFRKRKKIFNQF